MQSNFQLQEIKASNLINNIGIEYKKYVAPTFNPYLIEKIYIPVLRGLRPLINLEKNDSSEKNEKSNCYFERTQKDYFNENKKSEKEILTGLELYEDVKKHLLGYSDQREIIRKYENFLSVNFFENKPVNLVPHFDSDVLHIKIGDEKDLPIYDVGDGIQQLIILTYPLFKNIGKNMFVFMEEPELYLHPGLQRRFIEILKSPDFKTFKFFIATHSNNFLDLSLETENNDTSIYTFEKKTTDSKITFEVKNVLPETTTFLT
ncbi:MAG TPA: AAA family ATPase [bacterium]|nr:AAA family ATPase [bacterium]